MNNTAQFYVSAKFKERNTISYDDLIEHQLHVHITIFILTRCENQTQIPRLYSLVNTEINQLDRKGHSQCGELIQHSH